MPWQGTVQGSQIYKQTNQVKFSRPIAGTARLLREAKKLNSMFL